MHPTDTVTSSEIAKLQEKIHTSSLPAELREKADLMIDRAQSAIKFAGYYSGIEQIANYIDWITSLPWEKESDDNLDLATAAQILEKNHYGLHDIKNRITEYLAVLKLTEREERDDPAWKGVGHRAPILFFVGLVGIGKTTMAISVAEALQRKFIRIPFGGLGSALDLRGQSKVHPDAEPGLIIKALRRAGTRNPVILFDELDRVTAEARADIMGVLLELMDPEQNAAFVDHYIDYPFNLSDVLFIATANSTQNISTAVLDRFEPIRMPSYSDEEKIKIGRDYVLPKIMASSGLKPGQLVITDQAWPAIVRPLGFDAGMRTLERAIMGISRKAAKQVVENSAATVTITPENVKNYLYSDISLY